MAEPWPGQADRGQTVRVPQAEQRGQSIPQPPAVTLGLSHPGTGRAKGSGQETGPRSNTKALATLTGQRIGWEVARDDPLKVPREALGEPEMHQNSAPNHGPAPSAVKPDSGQATRVAERNCSSRAPGKPPHGPPKGRHTGCAGQASPVPPQPSPY